MKKSLKSLKSLNSSNIILIITICFLCILLGLFLGRNFSRSYVDLPEEVVRVTQSGSETQEDTTGKLNINTATKEQLMLLPGIGESLALRIIEYREENGSFQSAEDIKSVSGIGDSKYAQMAEYITAGDGK